MKSNTQINGKVAHVQILEELWTLIINSMQTPSNFNGSFYRSSKNNSKIYMKPQKIPTSQNNKKKEQKSGRRITSWIQAIF